MADNITLNAGTGGKTLASEDIGGAQHQKMKMGWGSAGTFNQITNANPLPVVDANTNAVQSILSRYLDTDGDGTGTKAAIGDYSGAVESFYIEPDPGDIYRINHLIVYIEDSSGMGLDEYGNIGAALTNGIQILQTTNNGATNVNDLTDGINIKTNGQWARLCYDASIDETGPGNDICRVRLSFSDSGAPIRLVGDDNDRLEVRLNDDFTGLVGHGFKVQGIIE